MTGRTTDQHRHQSGIVRLSITLRYVTPRVARRMDVPSDTHLEDLHQYIQAAMGWWNCHLWSFTARRYGQVADWSLDEDFVPPDATLLDVIAFLRGKTEFIYTYDFGDSWEHMIRIGRIQPARADRRYPFLVSGTGRCPPEDIGGSPGYARFLQAIEDPSSEYREYFPEHVEAHRGRDPEDAELDARRADLARYGG